MPPGRSPRQEQGGQVGAGHATDQLDQAVEAFSQVGKELDLI